MNSKLLFKSQKTIKLFVFILKLHRVLAGWPSWLVCHPPHQEVVGSIPVQGRAWAAV